MYFIMNFIWKIYNYYVTELNFIIIKTLKNNYNISFFYVKNIFKLILFYMSWYIYFELIFNAYSYNIFTPLFKIF